MLGNGVVPAIPLSLHPVWVETGPTGSILVLPQHPLDTGYPGALHQSYILSPPSKLFSSRP